MSTFTSPIILSSSWLIYPTPLLFFPYLFQDTVLKNVLGSNRDCTSGNPNTGGELWFGVWQDLCDTDAGFCNVAQSVQCRIADQGSWS
jgi:hypothetical protein